jgi:aminobenzoyl-glutamate utilization protein B
VPDEANIWIVIRDEDRAKVAAMTEWVKQIAEGAAMATQTTSEFDAFFGMYDLLPNEPMARLLHGIMSQKSLQFTAEEQAFAKACQSAMQLPEKGMMTQVLPFIPNKTTGGSTDVGDVSYLTPTAAFMWPTFPLGISLHTWPVTAAGGMSIGDKASLASAQIMTAAGYELMTNAKLRKAARDDFQARKGNTIYVSPIPADRTAPLDLPDFLTQNALSEYMNGFLDNE